MEKVDRIINFGEVSRLLSGSRGVIRRNDIPKKHAKKISDLRSKIRDWLNNID